MMQENAFVCNNESWQFGENMKCSICGDIMRTPVVLSACGHTFCETCLVALREDAIANKHCPECRSNNLEYTRNFAVEKVLNVLQGSCSRGECDWTGNYEVYKQHLCLYEKIDCSNVGCTWKEERRFREIHERECNFSLVRCTCQEEVIRYLLEEHQEKKCPTREIDCSFCLMKIKWNELILHMMECPERFTECSVPGCHTVIRQKDKERHNEQCLTSHVTLWQNFALNSAQNITHMDRYHRTIQKKVWEGAQVNSVSEVFVLAGIRWQLSINDKGYVMLLARQGMARIHANIGIVLNSEESLQFHESVWYEGKHEVRKFHQRFIREHNKITMVIKY